MSPCAIVQHLEREAELLDELADGVLHAGLIDADGHDAEVGILELAVERLERRHLDDAGAAPRRPDVEQHHLAAIIGQRPLDRAVSSVTALKLAPGCRA